MTDCKKLEEAVRCALVEIQRNYTGNEDENGEFLKDDKSHDPDAAYDKAELFESALQLVESILIKGLE